MVWTNSLCLIFQQYPQVCAGYVTPLLWMVPTDLLACLGRPFDQKIDVSTTANGYCVLCQMWYRTGTAFIVAYYRVARWTVALLGHFRNTAVTAIYKGITLT